MWKHHANVILILCTTTAANPRYLEDPDYRGIKAPRITGDEFDAFMTEVMESLKAWQPHMLLQFEDFGNNNAFRLLNTWRHKMCAFNDDIQVTTGICFELITSRTCIQLLVIEVAQ